MKHKILMIIIFLLVSVNIVFGEQIYNSIKVLTNSVNIIVNGKKVDGDNFVYNGTTYVPLKNVATLFGAEVSWDAKTRNVLLTTKTATLNSNEVIKISKLINAFDPTFSLSELSVTNIEAISVISNGVNTSVQFKIENNNILLTNTRVNYGGNILDLNSTYTMKLFTSNGVKNFEFKTSGLKVIKQENNATVYFIPSMPSKGFNWPYLLRIPGKNEVSRTYQDSIGKYLMLETANFGNVNNYDHFESSLPNLYTSYRDGNYYSINISASLNLPAILPIFPRYNAYFFNGGSTSYLYTHALDRDTAIFRELITKKDISTDFQRQFSSAGFNYNDFVDLDVQVINMADHARQYLNQNGITVNDKFFMYGYSASGTFSDRLVSLHPDRFRAYASGATLDDMVLPIAKYHGKDLIFPIGVSDYKTITGEEFSLTTFNQVARLIHMGAIDTNNTLLYSDCYGEDERTLIKSLFAEDVKTRADQLIAAYKEVGGKGIFILDQGISHGVSEKMREYLIEFFIANLNGTSPVYKPPTDSNQLFYTIYE